MNNVLQIENVSKQYQLGVIGSESLKHRMQLWWNKHVSRIPQTEVTEVEENNTSIWALRNVSFNVQQGDVLGLIGKNGSGKSTLLKILSRITKPTTGIVRGKGRIASLLEVGTGFHAELTGRENIYLNGQILGMKKREIDSRFNEIVAYSGVERFLDTPVKRYSSGMYVRLAFSVAAHLDADILIVDEALGVGDSDFQRKSIAKMREIASQEGKTVLFVSHNLQALRNLCSKAVYLDKGRVVDFGPSEKIITDYLKSEKVQYLRQDYEAPEVAPGNEHIRIKKVEVCPQYIKKDTIDIRTPLKIKFEFWYNKLAPGDLITGVHLFNFDGDCIFDTCSERYHLDNGLIKGECLIPGNFLNDGSYYVSIVFVRNTIERLYYFEACLSFDVADYRENIEWNGKWAGYVRPKFDVVLKHENINVQKNEKVQTI